MYAVALEQFSGPLHLLLELIESEKLDISEVALAKVTDQYLRYLEAHPDMPIEELADFLVVASRLLYIKSKILLPFLTVGEEDGQDLESQLKIYKEYLEASKQLHRLILRRRFLFVHERLPHVEIGFAPPEALSAGEMRDFFLAVIRRIEPVVRIPKAVIEKTVSIQEKIKEIVALMAKAKNVNFKTVLLSAESRTEIIVSFLALLELVKQRGVAVRQEKKFHDIVISKAETEPQPVL
ncbi:segregation/condensation protein A [Candidatus Uhrbacteria bacterium]|nr:segregation/condensation protein A [Candidatus Uhrbacteria bacterium]